MTNAVSFIKAHVSLTAIGRIVINCVRLSLVSAALGHRFAVPAVLQPDADRATLPSMATGDDVLVLRDDRVQFPLQHDVHISVLSNARGWLVPRQKRRLHNDVPLRGHADDSESLFGPQ